MRTAKEMYEYCKKKGFGQGQNEKWGIKHFSLIEEMIAQDENVLMPFIGLHNYVSMTKHDDNFAYAITNKRIVLAQKKMFGNVIQTVSINNINDITINTGIALGVITIDTTKEVFNVALDKISANAVYSEIHNVLDSLKNNSNVSTATNEYNDIYKLKELLDNGIITQDEFDTKKKQILGL